MEVCLAKKPLEGHTQREAHSHIHEVVLFLVLLNMFSALLLLWSMYNVLKYEYFIHRLKPVRGQRISRYYDPADKRLLGHED